ncbi:MAG: hypothetical protein WC907_07385 [Acholeplasmataceae bacterium]|jgi:hypothetical protein
MEESEIMVGKWYRAKNSKQPARYVLYISPDRKRVQIDGDEVGFGKRYPFKTMERFLKWCGGKAKTDEHGYVIGTGH